MARLFVRLFVIVARRSPEAVVFRRGPSKLVRLVRWNRSSDTFERGQWFRGRIYERRCDLSPRGDLLVYFAAKHRGPIPTFTAVSRPPFFTALCLYPSVGTYGGGGLFVESNELHLNHRAAHLLPAAPGHEPPRGFVVRPLGENAGRGEDEPIEDARRRRDGWELREPGVAHRQGLDAEHGWTVDPPRLFARPNPKTGDIELHERLHAVHERDGPWYVLAYSLVRRGTETMNIGRADWADWDDNGDLLLAREGRLFRVPTSRRRGTLPDPDAWPEPLIDLTDDDFEAIPPPAHATQWP